MFRQQRAIFAPVTLGRGDEANAAVTMLMVVPGDKVTHPEPCSVPPGLSALRFVTGGFLAFSLVFEMVHIEHIGRTSSIGHGIPLPTKSTTLTQTMEWVRTGPRQQAGLWSASRATARLVSPFLDESRP